MIRSDPLPRLWSSFRANMASAMSKHGPQQQILYIIVTKIAIVVVTNSKSPIPETASWPRSNPTLSACAYFLPIMLRENNSHQSGRPDIGHPTP